MTTGAIPFREATHRQRGNDASRWPARGADNRLEPECWPVLRPSFSVAPGATVFTMGSCFARNIEIHLDRLGFEVPAITLTRPVAGAVSGAAFGAELFNKYTPVSIVQELEWARAIRDRDDQVREDDVLPLLLDLGRDRFIDLHARADPGYGLPLADQVARRRLTYAWLRSAFDCDLAVITLGLIEAWWDTRTGVSIEMHPRAVRHPAHAHFAFRPLGYAEALAAVERSLALILDNPRARVLLTTSPVPLHTTFTDDDVIVANMMSKSLLRTVAGTVTQASDRVDYFPSYESIMLTKQASVWTNDLIHIEEAFIGRVMARVIDAYVEGGISNYYDGAMAFGTAVRGDALDEAARHYSALRDLPPDPALRALPIDLAQYEIAIGDHDTARRRLAAPIPPEIELADLFRLAWLLQELGEDAAAEDHRARAFARIATNWVLVHNLLVLLVQRGRGDEQGRLLLKAEAAFADNPDALVRIAAFHRERGDEAGYHRVMRALMEIDAAPEPHPLRAGIPRQGRSRHRARDRLAHRRARAIARGHAPARLDRRLAQALRRCARHSRSPPRRRARRSARRGPVRRVPVAGRPRCRGARRRPPRDPARHPQSAGRQDRRPARSQGRPARHLTPPPAPARCPTTPVPRYTPRHAAVDRQPARTRPRRRRPGPPAADATRDPLAFAPVPRKYRHDGWTVERQRAFIAALAELGSVKSACQRINLATTGAYHLRRQPGADSFRAAWEAALASGVQRLADIAIDRAIEGTSVPVFYHGEQVGERRRYNDRLLMFIMKHHMPGRYGTAALPAGTKHPETLAREAAAACPACKERARPMRSGRARRRPVRNRQQGVPRKPRAHLSGKGHLRTSRSAPRQYRRRRLLPAPIELLGAGPRRLRQPSTIIECTTIRGRKEHCRSTA